MSDAKSPSRRSEAALLAGAALVFGLLARYHARHVCDDAFIAFRYADHVVAGAGPVWNVGERVEGFSSPLWLLLLAIGRWLGASLPTWATAWGVACAAVVLLVVHRLVRALGASRRVAAAAVLGAALLYPLYYWAPAGLETTLFAALVTAAAWSLLTPLPRAWVPVAAGLGVARPEGPLLAAALVVLAAIARPRGTVRPRLVPWALAPALAWESFRLAYYGAWLPNTYAAKATGGWLERLTAGGLYATPALAAFAVTVLAMKAGDRARRPATTAMVFLGLGLAIVIGAGGDWMWHGRMLLPVLPALLAITVAGLAAAPPRRRFLAGVIGAVGWAVWLPRPGIVAAAATGAHLAPAAYQEGTLVSANLAAAAFLAEQYPAEALVAVNHAGALPYALPNPAVDMTGLCDRHIAREVAGGLHHKFDVDYVLGRRPRIVVLNSRTRPGEAGVWYHAGYWLGETALVAHPEFAAHYRPVPRFWSWQWQAAMGGGYVLLYERFD